MDKVIKQNTKKNFYELSRQQGLTQSHLFKNLMSYTPFDNPEDKKQYYARRGRKLYAKFEADKNNEGWLRVFDK